MDSFKDFINRIFIMKGNKKFISLNLFALKVKNIKNVRKILVKTLGIVEKNYGLIYSIN